MSHETDPEITLQTTATAAEIVLPGCADSCLVQIYPVGPAMARHVLKDKALVVGRDGTCDIRVADRTLSRHHVRIEPDGAGYRAVDLDSTNGTFVNEKRISTYRLQDGDKLYVGNAIFRYLSGGNIEAIYHEEIHRLAILDPLTGIHNQRYFLEILERELHRSLRYRRALTLLMLDVDCFKSVNDALGHLGGDSALRELTHCIEEVLRKEALFARYGGEEFVVLVPETTLDDGVRVAERIRAVVAQHDFRYDGRSFALTISVGVTATAGEEVIGCQELLRHADRALYQAKGAGRNCVIAEPATQGSAQTPDPQPG